MLLVFFVCVLVSSKGNNITFVILLKMIKGMRVDIHELIISSRIDYGIH